MFDFDSETMQILIIGALELSVVLLLMIVFLFFQNRSLKKLMNKMRERMQGLMLELKRRAPRAPKSKSYLDYLKLQIKTTQARHLALKSDQDIALDIDRAAPLPRRVVALRYAVLQAEIEGNNGKEVNWEAFQAKYEQLLSYLEDFSGNEMSEPVDEDVESPDVDTDELDLLREELTNAKKRINNLEKFKALYMDLDERWQNSKEQAQQSFRALSEFAEQVDDSDSYMQKLEEYHAAYQDFGELLESGVEADDSSKLEAAKGEIRHLRAVAAEQHSIISDLQRKLQDSTTAEEKIQVAEELQDELNKQMRFVQESETCIKLMEDELANANKELEQLRSRLFMLPELKREIVELREKNEELDNMLYSVTSDNRRLTRKLEEIQQAPPDDNPELIKYKRAFNELQNKYNELEEKYLDMKIQE